MRILDEKSNKRLDRVTVYLTTSEALELRDSLTEVIEKPEHHHSHIPSEDYQKEITVCIYDNKDLSSFDERSRKLIIEDE